MSEYKITEEADFPKMFQTLEKQQFINLTLAAPTDSDPLHPNKLAISMKTRSANNNQGETKRSQLSRRSSDSPIPSPDYSGVVTSDKSKSCCFCWFCCCSCSYLSVKSLPDDDERTPHLNEAQSKQESDGIDEKLSLEEVKKWGESFDFLMNSPDGQKVFREFLKMEYSDENILFWLACNELKKEKNAELVEEKARLIYEDYISILSPKEVSLDSRVREKINGNMIDPSNDTFDEAQIQIYKLMHQDSYPRFLNSKLYKDLLTKAEANS